MENSVSSTSMSALDFVAIYKEIENGEGLYAYASALGAVWGCLTQEQKVWVTDFANRQLALKESN